jgi:hypothetical protein
VLASRGGQSSSSRAAWPKCAPRNHSIRRARSAATYLSYALTDAGESERAERLLGDLAEEPLEAVDSYTRVRLFWSLGRVATREGRTLSGLAYFRRAIALLETTEDTLHLARAHVSCAWALSKSGRAQEAGGHLEVAEQLFGRKPTLPILAGCVPKRPSERSLSARASRRSLMPKRHWRR